MPKREKYVQHYKLSWEAEPEFKGRLSGYLFSKTISFKMSIVLNPKLK